MIDASLIDDFIPEAYDQLEILESNILRLESGRYNEEVISVLFRAGHTIKGSSEYIGLSRLATVAHRLENLLDMVRRDNIRPTDEMSSLLINLHDCMNSLVNDLLEYRSERTAIDQIVSDTDAFCEKIRCSSADDTSIGQAAAGSDTLDETDALFSVDEEPWPDANHPNTSGETDDPELRELENLLSREFDDVSPTSQVGSESENGLLNDIQDKNAVGTLSEQGQYEEEYDEELFGIFLDHLQENISRMLEVLAGAGKESPKDVLLHCAGIVSTLRSSAAYMDYGDLVSFYDAWTTQISSIRDAAEKGLPVSFSFITDYMDQVIQHFSLTEKFSDTPEYAKIHEPEGGTENGLDDAATQPPDDAVHSIFTEDIVDEEGRDESGHPDEPAMRDTGAGTPEPPDDQSIGLFDELDAVFDTAAEDSGADIFNIDPFEDDIEDELSSMPSTSALSDQEVEKSAPPPTGGPKREDKTPEDQPDPESSVSPAEPAKQLDSIVGENQDQKTSPLEDVSELPLDEKPAAQEPVAEEQPKAAPAEPSETQNTATMALSTDEGQSSKMGYEENTGSRVAKQTLRVATDKIDKLMNQVGELVVNRASYAQLYYEMRDFQRQFRNMGLDTREIKWIRDFTFRLSEATVAMGRVANDLQEGVMKIRMLPISQLFNRYPRLVRDLMHNSGKQVHLDVHGEDTELDKMVIEEIADPLVHIIRNAVDHGIETVEERHRKGKPPAATIKLNAFHESNHVVIEIIDDGCGIDLQQIRSVAVEKGFATREEVERMRPKEVMSIIMMPGFSISETITTVSGRGVGMDVVKKNVEKLNGTIEIDSEIDKGTRIRIKIPLTLAIINALLVKVGGEVFTIPLSVIEETLRVSPAEIYTIEGVEVIQLRDGVLSLLRLTEEFNKQSEAEEIDHQYVVVINTGMRHVGLVVDSLIGQEEAVIKPLTDFLQERSGFSGATILGDGSVSLILDVYELVNISMERKTSSKRSGEGLMDFTPVANEKQNSEARGTPFS